LRWCSVLNVDFSHAFIQQSAVNLKYVTVGKHCLIQRCNGRKSLNFYTQPVFEAPSEFPTEIGQRKYLEEKNVTQQRVTHPVTVDC